MTSVPSAAELIGCFPDRRLLVACYETGPGGYELHRRACIGRDVRAVPGALEAPEAKLAVAVAVAVATMAAWAQRDPLADPSLIWSEVIFSDAGFPDDSRMHTIRAPSGLHG